MPKITDDGLMAEMHEDRILRLEDGQGAIREDVAGLSAEVKIIGEDVSDLKIDMKNLQISSATLQSTMEGIGEKVDAVIVQMGATTRESNTDRTLAQARFNSLEHSRQKSDDRNKNVFAGAKWLLAALGGGLLAKFGDMLFRWFTV